MLQKFLIALVCLCFISTALAEIKCVVCDSSTTPECITNPSSLTAKTQCTATTSCYTKIVSGVVTRGCIDTSTDCKEPDCQTCTTDDCNSQQTVCQTCDSSTNAQCAQLTAANNEFNGVCPALNAQCYVGLSDTKTIRACASDTLTCTGGSQTCALCSGGNCNSNIFPSTRLTCYQCADTSSSTSCANPVLAGSGLTAKACVNYVAGDACYTYATSATTMQRGCVSDTNNNQNCAKDSTNALCATCSSNSCNSRTYTYQPSILCMQCNSNDTPGCADAQEESTAKSCEPIPYTAVGQCYSEVQNGTVYRGCMGARSSSLGDCTAENKCTICDTANGCNNAAIKATGTTCVQCRSDNDAGCKGDASKYVGVDCTGTQCYEIWFNNLYLRGCFDNALPQVKLICEEKDNKECKLCSTANCNIEKAPNGAALNSLTTSLYILLAFIALKTIY